MAFALLAEVLSGHPATYVLGVVAAYLVRGIEWSPITRTQTPGRLHKPGRHETTEMSTLPNNGGWLLLGDEPTERTALKRSGRGRSLGDWGQH